VGSRGLEGPGLPPAAERWLTLSGWVALAVIVYFCLRFDLIVRVYNAEPFFIVYIIMVALALGMLALYGVMNTYRIIRRGSSRDSSDFMDMGWGGWLMTHYTKQDETDLCGLDDDDDLF
jgi:hypothetical protein